ncbi:MAG: ATP-binding cassette domain-containing protein, partial [Gemmatimonadales bacterium]
MNQLLASAEGRNPSLPLALAALLRVIDEQQGAAFSDLAVAYREDHLELHRRVLGDVPGGGGVLSLDEVRRFLQSSVLPRLVGEGLVRVPPGDLDDQARIALAVAVGDADRAPLRTELLERAADALRQAEAPPAPTLPAGAVLQGEHLTKRYNRRRVVDDVAVQLRQGEIVGLLGPNGAGKTTTFYMIVGLVRPDRGRIALDGADISHEPMYRRARMGIGYLAQEPSVFRKLTVEENVLAIL